MRSHAELERLYAERPAPARGRGRIDLLVVRTAPGRHETPDSAEVSPVHGLAGDRWAKGLFWQRDPDRQLTLMMTVAAELVCDGQALDLSGDNLLVDLDLCADALPVGTRLRAGSALLQVSAKPHSGCKKFCARFGEDALTWVNDERGRARNLRGINCRVLEAGLIRVHDAIEIEPSP